MSMDEVKARVAAERGKLVTAFRTVVGARVTLAVLTLFLVGFGSHLLYSPDRLPPVAGLSLAQVGLPNLDLGETGNLAQQAREAAQRENVGGSVQGLLDEHRSAVPVLNGIGFGACLILLIWNVAINARDRRYRSQAALDREAALMAPPRA
ncbi:MAG: hypothetical protein WDM79_12255 [Terricaulis sp.]